MSGAQAEKMIIVNLLTLLYTMMPYLGNPAQTHLITFMGISLIQVIHKGRKAGRTSGGSDHSHSIEHSPLHYHYQLKAVNRGGVSSPSWERKVSSEGSRGHSSNSAGRFRAKAGGGRGDETELISSFQSSVL